MSGEVETDTTSINEESTIDFEIIGYTSDSETKNPITEDTVISIGERVNYDTKIKGDLSSLLEYRLTSCQAVEAVEEVDGALIESGRKFPFIKVSRTSLDIF